MNKIDIINEILKIYEENNELKNEIEFLKSKKQNSKKEEIKDNDNSLEKRIYRIGLKTLFEECFKGTYISRWSKNEDFKELEDWSNDNITLNGSFEEISKKEFKELFGDKIKNAYDKAIEKAIQREKEDKD